MAYTQLPGWRTDDHASALGALRRSCGRLKGGWRRVCDEAGKVGANNAPAARAFFERWFIPHRVSSGGTFQGLFTGYFEAELHGSWKRTARYRVPLYRVPDDLVSVSLGRFRKALKGDAISGRIKGGKLVPYPTRAEILAGALRGKGLELLWVDDPVDAFFLHIQGSGRAVMSDGRVVRLGYGGRNGRPYFAIGRELIARQAIAKEKMSMQAIRAWLNAHPRESDAVMNLNESFIFFRILKGDGPIGAQGVALTPGRSLAVDTQYVPFGTPVWLDTTDPLNAQPLQRLVIAQDRGGAIKGAVRGDLFWGYGEAAARKAGAMKQPGRCFLLWPRTVDVPR